MAVGFESFCITSGHLHIFDPHTNASKTTTPNHIRFVLVRPVKVCIDFRGCQRKALFLQPSSVLNDNEPAFNITSSRIRIKELKFVITFNISNAQGIRNLNNCILKEKFQRLG